VDFGLVEASVWSNVLAARPGSFRSIFLSHGNQALLFCPRFSVILRCSDASSRHPTANAVTILPCGVTVAFARIGQIVDGL
jgi:hypothetical protein